MELKNKFNRVIHVILRPAFGVCLFFSQWLSPRNSVFSENYFLLLAGIIFFVLGVLYIIIASIHLQRAIKKKEIASTGPYKYSRHPIYVGIYIFSIGLGFLFFTWYWFLVLIIFIPLWYLECKTEENVMLNEFGQSYLDYKKTTCMFFPKLC